MYVGVEFLTINVLLHTKSEQKVIGNKISTQIIFQNPLKPCFSIIGKEFTFTICVGSVWVVIVFSY